MNLPNLFTLLRMGMIPFFVIAVLQGQSLKALLLFLVAGLTDMLDGFFARTLRQTSSLGAYLDPIADKLLLTTAFVTLSVPGTHEGILIPMWITILVIARDVFILVIALTLALAANVRKFTPTMLSKINTVVQILAIIAVLASRFLPQLAAPAQATLYLVAGLTFATGVDYFIRANRMSEDGREST